MAEKKQITMDDIRRQAASVAESKEDYINILKYKMDERTAKEIMADKSKLKKAEKRIAQLEKVLNKLYEDRALDKITEVICELIIIGFVILFPLVTYTFLILLLGVLYEASHSFCHRGSACVTE